MKLVHKIMIGVAIPFAIAVGAAHDYHYDHYHSPKAVEKLKQKFDREVVPALRDKALSRCGDPDANIHGILAAKFIFDSHADDDVRKLLKTKRVDPQHGPEQKQDGGDGYMTIEFAHKFAEYLLKNDIAMTVEPDRHNGQRQLDYLNNGVPGMSKRLVIYYQKAADGSDSIQVPTSPALHKFLKKLMTDKHTDVAKYQIIRDAQAEGGWRLHKEKLVMDGPAAPVSVQKPTPNN